MMKLRGVPPAEVSTRFFISTQGDTCQYEHLHGFCIQVQFVLRGPDWKERVSDPLGRGP